MPGRRSLVVGAAAGVLVGALATGVVLASGWLDQPEPVEDEQAVAELLQAWAANRNGTFVTESSFVRTTDEGRELRSDVRVAQRPPVRLIVQFDSVDARVDGRRLRCFDEEGADAVPGGAEAAAAGELVCGLEGEEGASYAELVDEELRVLLSYFVGDPPLYEVHGDGEGCFELEQVRDLPVLPYGHSARFCFDGQTGAMVFARIERDEATDVSEAYRVTADVSDDDLIPPLES